MDYHLLQLTSRMTEMVFGKREWTLEDTELFHKLAMRFIVLNEEHNGLTACRVTTHFLMHVREDAMRFSHPDNYWCFTFERAVKHYVGIVTNFKNIECSYAKTET